MIVLSWGAIESIKSHNWILRIEAWRNWKLFLIGNLHYHNLVSVRGQVSMQPLSIGISILSRTLLSSLQISLRSNFPFYSFYINLSSKKFLLQTFCFQYMTYEVGDDIILEQNESNLREALTKRYKERIARTDIYCWSIFTSSIREANRIDKI